MSDKKEEKLPLYYEDDKVRKKIDAWLKQIADLECSLGSDSTEKERVKIKVKQDRILQKIKDVDLIFYEILVPESER